MPQNTVAKIPDVGRPFSQVLVIGRLERSRDVLDGGLDRPFGVDLLLVDVLADPLAELRVIEQGTMRIENLRLRPAEFSLYALLQTRQVFGSALNCGFEASVLFTGHGSRDPVMRNRGPPPSDDMGIPSGQAG